MSETFASSIPKAAWHTHSIGALAPETIRSLAVGRDDELAAMHPEAISESFRFTSLVPFLDDFGRLCDLVTTPQALYTVAMGLGEYAVTHNIHLMVATHTPTTHPDISMRDQVSVLKDAADEVYDRTGGEVTVRYLFDIMYGESRELGRQTLEAVRMGKAAGVVVGLSVAGDETRRPLTHWAAEIREAQSEGVGFAPHAGEGRGADNVRNAIELGAVRIAHGVRAIEDPGVVRELAVRGIPLDICPTSNRLLGVYPDIARHPALQLAEAGVPLTFDTDDPTMFGTTPAREVQIALEMGFTEAQIIQTLRTSLDPVLLSAQDYAHVEGLLQRDLRRMGHILPPRVRGEVSQ